MLSIYIWSWTRTWGNLYHRIIYRFLLNFQLFFLHRFPSENILPLWYLWNSKRQMSYIYILYATWMSFIENTSSFFANYGKNISRKKLIFYPLKYFHPLPYLLSFFFFFECHRLCKSFLSLKFRMNQSVTKKVLFHNFFCKNALI